MVPFKSLALFVAVAYLRVFSDPSWAAELGKAPVASDRVGTPAPTRIKPVDINSGSIEQLRALPGIEDSDAQRIIADRPYQKKEDLVSRKIIPEMVFEKIKDRIITVKHEARPATD